MSSACSRKKGVAIDRSRHPAIATNTSSVPVTFASFEASGSFTDRGTEGMAAKMPSAPGKVSIRRSVMLPSMNVTRGWSRRCSIFTRSRGYR
ncbi:MAG: hypothetical protein WC993_06115 [Methanoculleus sp.]